MNTALIKIIQECFKTGFTQKSKIAFSILFFLISFAVFSQEKKEVEKRIDKAEMPRKAVVLYEAQVPKNIRWERFYFEQDGEKESFEAKFKFKKHVFSIEFSKAGGLQDIEIAVKKNRLPEPVRNKIEVYLDTENDLYNIEKIQAQFLPKRSPNQTFEVALNFKEYTADNYELVVAVRNDGLRKKYELLFDHHGNFVQKREISFESPSFFLF